MYSGLDWRSVNAGTASDNGHRRSLMRKMGQSLLAVPVRHHDNMTMMSSNLHNISNDQMKWMPAIKSDESAFTLGAPYIGLLTYGGG